MLSVLQQLLRGDGTHPGRANLGHLVHDGGRELDLSLNALASRDGHSPRQEDQVDHTKRQKPPDFKFVTGAQPLEAENRIWNVARLVRGGNLGPALSHHCLQRRAVGQGQAHCGILRQGLAQKLIGDRKTCVSLFLGAAQLQVTAGELGRRTVGLLDGIVDAEGSTACQNRKADGAERQT